jgi:hypothetical protein
MSMDAETFGRVERLLDRELSIEEKERLRRIKDTLQISDNDALWDIITAMEYQRTYYEELPGKIALATAKIVQNISVAAEKEVALAQGRLAESVVKQAEKLSVKSHTHAVIFWGTLALFLLLLYGSLLMWAGYSIGSGQTQPPALLLQMPVGIITGALCFSGGIFFGVLAAKNFADGNAVWRKRLLAALCGLFLGGLVFSFALF